MTGRIGLAIALGVVLALLWPGFTGSQEREFQFADWEKRINRRQPPIPILDASEVKPGMVIGEIGAGGGRMTLWLADRVGNTGKIYANDIDGEALERLAQRTRREGLDNVETILGRGTNPRLPEGTLDMVFMINVYHHVDEPVELIRNALPALKPSGTLVIVECDPAKVDWGEEEHCTGKDEMLRQLGQAGYELIRIEGFLSEDQIYVSRRRE